MKALDISKNKFKLETLTFIMTILKTKQGFESLALAGCGLSDECSKPLIKALA